MEITLIDCLMVFEFGSLCGIIICLLTKSAKGINDK